MCEEAISARDARRPSFWDLRTIINGVVTTVVSAGALWLVNQVAPHLVIAIVVTLSVVLTGGGLWLLYRQKRLIAAQIAENEEHQKRLIAAQRSETEERQKRLIAEQKAESEKRQKHFIAAQKTQNEERSEEITRQINDLENRLYNPLQTKLLLGVKRRLDGETLSKVEIVNFWRELIKILEDTCKTAAGLHTLLRPDVSSFDCNVKFFVWDDDNQCFCFDVVARASPDQRLREDDLKSEKNQIPVRKHFIYDQLTDPDFRKGDAYPCPDIEAEIQRYEETKKIVYPDPDWIPYKSMMPLLIIGPEGSIMGSGRVMRRRGNDIVGVICADAPVKGAFGTGPKAIQSSQLMLMRKLASMIFRLQQTMSLITDQRLVKPSRHPSKKA